jgi:hypothetical protein
MVLLGLCSQCKGRMEFKHINLLLSQLNKVFSCYGSGAVRRGSILDFDEA